MRSRPLYYLIALLILFTEIAIAKGIVGNAFIRGSVGDILVIVLIYALMRANSIQPKISAVLACLIGFIVEGLQYIHLVDLLGLQKGSVLAIAIGNTFSPSDLLMYCIGGILAFSLDQGLIIPRIRAG
ncbi:DUF2809 domain-containing protein [Iodobacter sp. CM08]|uniref:ribosomal maturation YjgA family protein n=1 Tax=Iodobacter sp. CM08 TaxID=3085902 RepID=UPI002980F3A2|nr:DUF2809 domain-containing protein [Iodobacter sp. CM08]MDW5418778.1 DUF2809 domain-containing protein [Iodobacter sp. CM08]